jgi:osmotically-inducible protein OsmY
VGSVTVIVAEGLMFRVRPVAAIVAAVLLPLALGGCAVGVVGGVAAAGGAGYTAGQERGMTGAIDDFELRNAISLAWSQAIPPLHADLDVSVYEGRALLTGRAPSPEAKQRARRIASAVSGVRDIYDEIEVGPQETALGVAQDAWITAQLRSELLVEPHLRAINYTIETAGRSVYLLGSARTQAELDRATQIARYVPHVKRVVSYVQVRPGAPVAARSAPPAAPPGARGPDAPSAAPSTPVEVRKL